MKQNAASAVLNRIPASADVMRWTVMNMRRSAKIMRLIDADAMNEELFYKQVGGKDSLITAESAFKMILF